MSPTNRVSRSTARTRPVAPTLEHSHRVMEPPPAPASRQRQPGPTPRASSRRSSQRHRSFRATAGGARRAPTRCRSNRYWWRTSASCFSLGGIDAATILRTSCAVLTGSLPAANCQRRAARSTRSGRACSTKGGDGGVPGVGGGRGRGRRSGRRGRRRPRAGGPGPAAGIGQPGGGAGHAGRRSVARGRARRRRPRRTGLRLPGCARRSAPQAATRSSSPGRRATSWPSPPTPSTPPGSRQWSAPPAGRSPTGSTARPLRSWPTRWPCGGARRMRD